jgi:hypothetical protein
MSLVSVSLSSAAAKPGEVFTGESALGEQPGTSPRVSSPHRNAARSPQASASELSIYRSAPSTPVIAGTDSAHLQKPFSPISNAFSVSAKGDTGCPTEQERERALMIFENRGDEIEPGTAAAWLGDSGSDRERIRRAYMELFDWANLDILTAVRSLCDRIALKGETQHSVVYNLLNHNHVLIQINCESKPVIMIRFADSHD